MKMSGNSFHLLAGMILVGMAYRPVWAVDTDGDGLSDADEIQRYLTDPSREDTDGDGMNDALEFQAGTDPLDAASFFYLDIGLKTLPNGQVVSLDFSTERGRKYALYRRSSLTTGNWEVVQADIDGTGTTLLLLDSGALLNPSCFYKVETLDATSGRMTRDVWKGLSGPAVSDLTGHANYPGTPSFSTTLETLEAPSDWDDDFGERIYGYLIPPVSGSYTFWIASDGASELWLSTDPTEAKKQKIAYVNTRTGARQWDIFGSQKSASIPLVGGQRYYIEVLHKAGAGEDHMAVAWETAGIPRRVIDQSYLSHARPLAPVVANDQYDALEGTLLTVNPIGILRNDSDPDNDPLSSLLIRDANHGTLNLLSNGSFTYLPDAGFHGFDSFVYQANDGTLDSINQGVVSLRVNGSSFLFEEDFESAAWAAVSNPASGSYETITAAVRGKPSNPQGWQYKDPNGDAFNYYMNHGQAFPGEALPSLPTKSFGLKNHSTAFVELSGLGESGTLDVQFDYEVTVASQDFIFGLWNGEPVYTGNANDAPLDLSNAEDSRTLVLPLGAGTVNLTLNYTDVTARLYFVIYKRGSEHPICFDNLVISHTVAPLTGWAPVALDDSAATPAGTPLEINVLANDQDTGGDALFISSVTQGALGSVVINGTTLTYSPAIAGSDTFTYIVSDGTNSDSATVSVTVSAVQNGATYFAENFESNDWMDVANPAMGKVVNVTTRIRDSLTNPNGLFCKDSNGFADNFFLGYGASYMDSALSYLANTHSLGLKNHTVIYVPLSGVSAGARLEVQFDFDMVTVQQGMAVGIWNAPPTFSNQENLNYSDALDVESLAVPSGVNAYRKTFDTTGATGTVFLVISRVGWGAILHVDNIAVTDPGANVAPLTVPDHYLVTENIVRHVHEGVGVNDSDLEGDPMFFTLVSQPSHGSVVMAPDGSFSYTPEVDYTGSDSFVYRSSDATGSRDETVTLTVDAVTVYEDTGFGEAAWKNIGTPGNNSHVEISTATLPNGWLKKMPWTDGSYYLANKTGPSGNLGYLTDVALGLADARILYRPLTGLAADARVSVRFRYEAVKFASFAYVALMDSPPTYGANYNLALSNALDVQSLQLFGSHNSGDAHFVLDSSGAVGTVYLVIFKHYSDILYIDDLIIGDDGVDLPPVAGDDRYSVEKNVQLNVPAGGVLNNDDPRDYDTLTAHLVSAPAHGSLSLQADGSFTYLPLIGYTGQDSFTYRASDGSIQTDVTTVQLEILDVDNPNVVSTNWPFAGNAEIVAAASYAGFYAVANRSAADSVEIRDIRGNLYDPDPYHATFTPAPINRAGMEALMTASISGADAGISGMAFTASGRQLFLAVCGAAGVADNDAILAFNVNTQTLRLFADGLDLARTAGKLGMVHHKGQLYVGTDNGKVLQFRAQRNDFTAGMATEINVGDSRIIGMCVDRSDDELVASTAGTLYRLTSSSLVRVQEISSALSGIKAVGFGRTYGAEGRGGLYILADNGTRIYSVETAMLRGGNGVSPGFYHEADETLADIALTPCGRMLTATATGSAAMLSDTRDTRMGFEDWVVDEFDQYERLARNTLWPANSGWREGWIYGSLLSTTGQTPVFGNTAHNGNAAWVSLMLMAVEEVKGDSDVEGILEKILLRHSGLHPDGVGPKAVDFHVDGNYNPDTGASVQNNNGVYEVAKMAHVSAYVKERYPNNATIVAAVDELTANTRFTSDRIYSYMVPYQENDQYGPNTFFAVREHLHFYQESYMYSALAAADDERLGEWFEEWGYDYSNLTEFEEHYLQGEPGLNTILVPAFVHTYGQILFDFYRDSADWRKHFRNVGMTHSSWTDDHRADYLTSFSAGALVDYQFEASAVVKHTYDITHFPSMIARGMYGDTTPVVAAYFAYRDGKRQQLVDYGNDQNPNLLTRHSNEFPEWPMPNGAMVDFHFGLHGLAEMIKPGTIDTICSSLFRPAGSVKEPNGDSTVSFSQRRPRRVLASTDGTTWTSYGYRFTPVTFDASKNYTHFDVQGADGTFLKVENAGFEDNLSAWTTLGDYTISTQTGILGNSLEIKPETGDSDASSAVYQDLDVSADFDGTEYSVSVMAECVGAVNGNAQVSIEWYNSANALVETDLSPAVSSANPFDELEMDIVKPTGAVKMRLVLRVNKGVPLEGSQEIYRFDQVTVVLHGVPVSMANAGFESGLTDWTQIQDSLYSAGTVTAVGKVIGGSRSAKLGFSSNSTRNRRAALYQDIDISGDPLNTRYIISSKLRTGNNADDSSASYIDAVFDSDSDNSSVTRVMAGETVCHTNTDRNIEVFVRRRSNSETILRVLLGTTRRTYSPSTTTVAENYFDDVKVYKMFPR